MRDAPPPSWRDTNSDSTEPSGSRGWQRSGPPSPDDSVLPSKRNLRRVFATFFLLAIVVAIGVLFLLPSQIKPTCLVLIGSSYDQNMLLPPNIYGWNGMRKLEEICAPDGFVRDRFARLFSQPNKLRRAGDIYELNDKTGWSDAWKEIAKQINKGDKDEKTVVLYFSMHGYADEQDAYLLRNIASVQSLEDFHDKCRIPFHVILDSLKTVKDKQVVVCLEVCHFESHWPIGVLHNDFVERLQSKYGKKISEAGNLTVICSSAPDQRSWPAPELQTTWFAHAVVQGILGEGRPNSGNVTALTLFKYLQKSVDEQTRVNRGREQTPILIGEQAEEHAQAAALVHAEQDSKSANKKKRVSAEFDLTALGEEWNKWKRLKTEYAPYVYSPQLWRLYQETLLRYEHVRRAGDPTGAGEKLRSKLVGLHQEIIDAKGLKAAYRCVGNNFPIHRVLGFHAKSDAEVTDEMLWAYYSDPTKGGAVLSKYSPPDETRYLLARLGQLVFQRKLEAGDFDQKTDRNRFAEITTDLQLTHRPVELQLLKMLEHAQQTNLNADTIKQALRIRMLAEATALSVSSVKDERSELYAEVIFRQIKDSIVNADIARREGEDLLFGDPSEDAKAARRKLDDAAEKYGDIRAEADRLRKTLALRDEIAADLPFMAAWLANLQTSDDFPEVEKLRADAETLGEKLTLLNRSVTGPKKLPSNGELTLIRTLFERVGEQYQSIGINLKNREGNLQKTWHAIDALLDVPPLGLDLRAKDAVAIRMELHEKLRGISEYLQAKQGTGQKEGDPRKERWDRQEKLLNACLKPYGVKLETNKAVDPGDAVREFLFSLPGVIRTTDGAGDEKTLQPGANVCRVIPGALADPLRNVDTEKRINPVERLRRVRTFELLQWLAERTVEDHWFDTADETYYKPTAEAYLDSARSLFGDTVPKSLANHDARIRASLSRAGLVIGTSPNPYWTTEVSFPLDWKIDIEQGVPAGMPMVWLEGKKPGKSGETRFTKPRVKMDKKPFNATFGLTKDQGVVDGDVVTVHAFYRGQHRTLDLPLRRPPPDLVIHHPSAPENVGFAVRMDSGFDYGAISIVLDNSGSMKWRHPKKGATNEEADPDKNERRRYDFALDALDHVLARVPNRTSLSILTLGRRAKPKDIQEITRIRAPKPWLQDNLEDLRANLTDLPGELGSPIADGIVAAMKTGFPIGFKGPKIVIALTDGDDNGSFGSTYRAGNLQQENDHAAAVTAGLLKANREHPDVQVIVVCFIQKEKGGANGSTEYERAEAQFKVVRKFELESELHLVPDASELGNTIESFLRPRVQLKLGDKEMLRSPDGRSGRAVNYHSDKALNWEPSVPANNYRASILRTHKNQIEAKMPRGHDIFGVLKRDTSGDGKLILERGLLGRQPEILEVAGDNWKEENGWQATLLHNHIGFGDRRLSQLIAFEKSTQDTPPVLKQTHPAFVWLELKGNRPSGTLFWGKEWSTVAAAYRLEMRDWPKQPPVVSAWYWPDEREPFLESTKVKMHFRRDENVQDYHPVTPPTQGTPPIESVVWEPPPREFDHPAGKKQIQDCIVVRFRYPKDRPIFVDIRKLHDSPEVGAIHVHYLDAGKGTAFFYGLPRQKTVELVWFDIDEFKKAATNVTFAPRQEYKAPTIFVQGAR